MMHLVVISDCAVFKAGDDFNGPQWPVAIHGFSMQFSNLGLKLGKGTGCRQSHFDDMLVDVES